MCQMFAGQLPASYAYESRSIRLNGHSTSIRLEKKFWETIDEIALGEGSSTPKFVSRLHSEVGDLHGGVQNFASLLRCACLVHMEKELTAAR